MGCHREVPQAGRVPPPTGAGAPPVPVPPAAVAGRLLHVDRRILQNAVRNVLDGELLNRYLYLSTMERGELAKKIGTTPDIVSGAGPWGSGVGQGQRAGL